MRLGTARTAAAKHAACMYSQHSGTIMDARHARSPQLAMQPASQPACQPHCQRTGTENMQTVRSGNLVTVRCCAQLHAGCQRLALGENP